MAVFRFQQTFNLLIINKINNNKVKMKTHTKQKKKRGKEKKKKKKKKKLILKQIIIIAKNYTSHAPSQPPSNNQPPPPQPSDWPVELETTLLLQNLHPLGS